MAEGIDRFLITATLALLGLFISAAGYGAFLAIQQFVDFFFRSRI